MYRSLKNISWVLAVVLLAGKNGMSTPDVVAVSPAPQSMSGTLLQEITVEFDTAMDLSTLHAGTIMVAGRWSGVRSATYSLESDDHLLRIVPLLPFSSGEWVTVALSKGVGDA